MILDVAGLWQMYTFSCIFLLSSMFMYGFFGFVDPCLLITGKSICNLGAEAYTSRLMAIGLLYVGTFFLALTYINKNNTPKLKRLASMGMNCIIALIVSIIFIGSTSQGGYENSILHFLDLITGFILLGIMISAIADDSDLAAPNSPLTGFGINPKTFILFIGVLAFIKIFVLSEFVNLSLFLSDKASITHFSRIMWQWDIVILLMILFPLSFALIYGDEKDQETLTGVIIFIMIISEMSIFPMSNSLKEGLITMSLDSFGVVTLLALIAIYAGRKRRNEYEQVSDSTADA